MQDEIDPFDFVLAEALGKSLAWVGELSNLEVVKWKAFYVYRAAMRKEAE